jgi:hypothetical protein
MANLQTTCIIGTFTLGTTCNVSAPGYVWINSTSGLLEYSYCTGVGIGVCTYT